MDHPSFLRPLDLAEDDRAKSAYEALQANISLGSAGAPAAQLERTRILNAQGGLVWSDPEHLRALANVAAESGDEEAWLIVPGNEGIERASVVVDDLAALVSRHDFIESDVFDAVTRGWSTEVVDLLAPPFVTEWTLVSRDLTWIFSSWNAGDLSALAGSRALLEIYAKIRPSAPSEVITWMLTEGETAADDDPKVSAIAGLRRGDRRQDFLFAESALGGYLTAHYGEAAADELWAVTQGVRATDSRRGLTIAEQHIGVDRGIPLMVGEAVAGFPGGQLVTAGTPEERLGKRFAAEPQLSDRLFEIWRS
jgi:hypothetical protein